MEKPLVSIIMPSRNGALTIGESIRSVVAQSYPFWELLVIDDGSTDGTAEIVEGFASSDSRIRLIRNKEPGKGVGSARNVGLRRSKGDYISFLDCDDIWFPWSIKHRLDHMLHTGADITYGSYVRLLPNGRVQARIAKPRLTFDDMLMLNQIGNLTGMYSSRALGLQMQESIGHEDYLMWLMLVKRASKVTCDPSVHLGFYRVHSNSLSGNKHTAFLWHWRIIRGKVSVGLMRALYLQSRYLTSALVMRAKR